MPLHACLARQSTVQVYWQGATWPISPLSSTMRVAACIHASALCALQPALLAQELGNWQPAHGEVEVSPYTHLERWTNSTLSALQVCSTVQQL